MPNTNLNFEEIPKHEVSNKALERLKKIMYQQDEYGIKKYGEPVHHSLQYDWESMQDEELADFFKYRECARQRKMFVIEFLEAGMRSEEPKEYIEVALQLLTVKGTGK